MRLKTLTVSVVILAVISAVVYIAQRPGPPPSTDPRVGKPLVDRAVIEKAAQLRVSDQGKTVTLTRAADGSWLDHSYYDLPADFSKLSSFVDNLHSATVKRFVTSRPERLARLDFKDTKIELLAAGAKPLWSITVGKSADTGGRFIEFDDEKKSYLATLDAWIDSDPKNWANAELLNVKADDVAKVEVGFPADGGTPAETVTVSRAKKDAPWTADKTPAGERVDPDKVASLLGSIGSVRFTDTNDLNDPNVVAARQHERLFKVTTFDGKTYTVAMGRKPEEKKVESPTTGKTGPAALGSVTALAKQEEADKGGKKPAAAKPIEPKVKTIPAGPVFVFISSKTASDPINALMKKRAFQIGDYIFTGLPQKPADLFQAAPKAMATPAAKPAAAPGEKKPEPATK